MFLHVSFFILLLPNITGSIKPSFSTEVALFDTLTGVFDSTGTGNVWVKPNTSAATRISQYKFNASRSSSYYGASAKPQVDSYQALMIIRA